MTPSPRSRRWDYDLLRVGSMVGVVYLHCAAAALRSASGAVWHFANLASSLATAAVPLFFMLSGALLLSQEGTADLSALFGRRLPKVLLPLAAWSALVVLLTLLRAGPAAALEQLSALPNTPAMVPYWFLYALIPVYLLSPFLKKMADGLTDAHWNYLVLLWLVLTIGVNTVRDFLPLESAWRTVFTVHWTLNVNLIGGYLGYCLLGARLARLRRLPSRRVLWLVSLACVLIIAGGTWWLRRSTGAYDESFKSYLHVFTALLSGAVFLLARSYGEARRSGRLLTFCSGLSFGIYLAHPLAISFWERLWPGWMGSTFAGMGAHLLFFAAVLLSCFAGVLLAASLPGVCFLLTGQSFRTACRECNLPSLIKTRGPN